MGSNRILLGCMSMARDLYMNITKELLQLELRSTHARQLYELISPNGLFDGPHKAAVMS